MIEFLQVTKRYPGGQLGLDEVSLQIPKGELVFLTGPSGAGKTTFLKLIYREEMATEGYILVNGRNVSSLPRAKVPYLRRTIGVVFQSFPADPRKTVFENVSLPAARPRLDARSSSEARLRHPAPGGPGAPHERLSHAALGRRAAARGHRPGADQPSATSCSPTSPPATSIPSSRKRSCSLFLGINLEGTTVIFATHDRGLIERVGRRVLTLEDAKLVGDRHLPGELVAPRRPTDSKPRLPNEARPSRSTLRWKNRTSRFAWRLTNSSE